MGTCLLVDHAWAIWETPNEERRHISPSITPVVIRASYAATVARRGPVALSNWLALIRHLRSGDRRFQGRDETLPKMGPIGLSRPDGRPGRRGWGGRL